MERKILTVFVASPGDLAPERDVLRQVSERLNRVLGPRIGWLIELVGWEDRRPGYGRAQALINEDVDRCDLFVGLLWKRWGEPSGAASSGFEEEFTRARERRRTGGQPEIWLFFKAISEDLRSDPGEQLKKVLAFQAEQQTLKELLYKPFESTEAFADVAYDSLTTYLLDLYKSAVPQSEAKRSEHHSALPETADEQEAFPQELSAALSNALSDRRVGWPKHLNKDQRARILLASTSWVANEFDYVLLGTHEANLAYTKREEWSVVDVERALLLRTMLSSSDDTIPGWYWATSLGDSVNKYLIAVAQVDTNDEVRKGAARLLPDAIETADTGLLQLLLNDRGTAVAGLRLVERFGDADAVELVASKLEDADFSAKSQAAEVVARFYLRSDIRHALEVLSRHGNAMPADVLAALTTRSPVVSREEFIAIFKKATPGVKVALAGLLLAEKPKDVALAREMLTDADHRVRRIAARALIDAGELRQMEDIVPLFKRADTGSKLGIIARGLFDTDYVDPEEFRPILLHQLSAEQLLEKLDFYSLDGSDAYRELACHHFSAVQGRIRSDIADRFEALRLESLARMAQQFGIDGAGSIAQRWSEDLLGFLRSRFMGAALDGIALHGEPADVRLARDIATESKLAWRVIGPLARVLARFGSAADVAPLIPLAGKATGDDEREIALTAFRLSDNPMELAQKLIHSARGHMLEQAIEALTNQPWADLKPLVTTLISDSSPQKRLVGVRLALCSNDAESERLLREYTSRESYYYNVVAWLDRLLYAPPLLREAFRRQLISTFKDRTSLDFL